VVDDFHTEKSDAPIRSIRIHTQRKKMNRRKQQDLHGKTISEREGKTTGGGYNPL
jgi:hypothetical protein